MGALLYKVLGTDIGTNVKQGSDMFGTTKVVTWVRFHQNQTKIDTDEVAFW